MPPETENPVPVVEAELTVTATVPFEVTVTDCDTSVFTETLPKAMELVLRPNDCVAAFNCSAALFVDALALAVKVAVCVVVTEATVAVNEPVLAPDATDTLAGTVTALSLLVRATLRPPEGAAEVNDTVHAVDPAPVKVLVPHAIALTVGAGAFAFNCSAMLREDELALAVKVAV